MKKFIIPISMVFFLTGCGEKQEITDVKMPQKVEKPEYQKPPKHSDMKGVPLPTKLNEKGEVFSDPNRIMLNDSSNDKVLDNSLME